MKAVGRAGLGLTLAAVALLGLPAPAAGYVGPGAALAVIGAAIAVVGAVFVTVGGFIWYPVKRVWKAMGHGKGEPDSDGE